MNVPAVFTAGSCAAGIQYVDPATKAANAARNDLRPVSPGIALFLVFLLAMVVCPAAWAAIITVSLDRNPVPLNESFSVIFSADAEPDGDPDFSPLAADFEILNQGHSSQISVENGRYAKRITWQLQVMAKRAGTLQIPAIAFGADRSNPFSVTVTNGAVRSRQGAEASIFVETEAEPKNPYVQAQVILTVRVLSRVAFTGDLEQPQVGDAIVEKLDEDREYMALRDGVQFKVNERRYVVFPQKSGPLTIGPVNLTAQMGGGSFGPFFRSSGRQQRLHSEPLTLEVRPIPTRFKGKHWLPAAKLDLTESWQPTSLKAPTGEPVTRTLNIQADGASIGMLPDLGDQDLPTAELKHYPDQPVTREDKTGAGLSSQRSQKTAFIAGKPGSYRLPAIEIPWWNTVTDTMEVARLPAQTLTALPTAQAVAPEPEPPAAPKPVPNVAGSDRPVESAGGGSPPPPGRDPLWLWLALLFGAGWLLTALAWWQSSRRGRPAPAVSPDAEAGVTGPRLIKALEKACSANDAGAARKALERWAAFRWPQSSAADALEARLGGIIGPELRDLNRCLYAPSGAIWQGGALWQGFQRYLDGEKVHDTVRSNPSGVLEPLHRL